MTDSLKPAAVLAIVTAVAIGVLRQGFSAAGSASEVNNSTGGNVTQTTFDGVQSLSSSFVESLLPVLVLVAVAYFMVSLVD